MNGRGGRGPGRVGRWLLRRVWGADGEFLVADITEVAGRRAGRGEGGLRLRLWIASQVLRSTLRGVVSRGRRGAGRTPAVGAPGRFDLHPGVALRLALRGLRRDLPTSLVVVGILALGIAAPAIFFSLMWGGGMRPLPVPEGDRVVRIGVVSPVTGQPLQPRAGEIESLVPASTLEGIAGWASRTLTLRVPGWSTTRLNGAEITPGGLELLRVSPAMGRVPSPGDAGGVLLGWSVWQEVFDGDPGLVGQEVRIDGAASTVAGVMPEGFGFPLDHEAWVVLDPAAAERPVALFARLGAGIDPERAAAELTPRWRRTDVLRAEDRTGGAVTVEGYTRRRGESGEAFLFLGLVVVGVALLVIAAVNASNLLMVRAVERVNVLGVQAALGAGRAQIGLQLMLEALTLSALGGAGGLALTHRAVEYIQTTASANFGYYWMRMQVELPVVLFVGALVVGTALLAGILPVRRVLRMDLQGVLKRGSAGAPGRDGGMARLLTGGQLALSCAALVAAGLASRAIDTASDFGAGLPVDEVVVATVDLPPVLFESEAEREAVRTRLGSELSSRIAGVPIALATGAPGYFEPASELRVSGYEPLQAARAVTLYNAVTSGYFDLFDIEVEQGRAFSPADDARAPRVAIVNHAWVRRWIGGDDPIGAQVTLAGIDSTATWQVVGVVETIPLGLGTRATEDRVYLPAAQLPSPSVRVLARRAHAPLDLVPELRRALAEIDPDLTLSDPITLREGHRYMTRAQRTLSLLAAGGGYAGLLVAAVGLYGLLAFRVRQRRRELGVRLALGADGPRLGVEVLRYALHQILPAMVVGLGLAWLAAPALGAILLGHDARGVSTFLAVGALFLGVGLLSALWPAWTASRVQPADVLRAE